MQNNLKRLRQAAGLTQKALAEATGIPLRTIQDWEDFRRRLTDIYILRQLADTLNCSIDDIVPGED